MVSEGQFPSRFSLFLVGELVIIQPDGSWDWLEGSNVL
jgi:hypothetical protein